jgi:hypothetical protein
MITDHTAILGTTAMGISTGPPQSQPSSQRSAPREFQRASKSIQQEVNSYRKSHITRNPPSVQRVDPGNQQPQERVPRCYSQQRRYRHTTVISSQAPTRVLIGSACRPHSSRHSLGVRSVVTSTCLLPLSASAYPLDRFPPLPQLSGMLPLYTGDFIEDGCLSQRRCGIPRLLAIPFLGVISGLGVAGDHLRH